MSLLRALALLWLIRKGLRLARSLVVAAAGRCLAGHGDRRCRRGRGVAARLAARPAVPRRGPVTAETVVYLTGSTLRYHRWQGVALGVAGDWQQATSLLAHARIAQAALIIGPVAAPAGLAAGGAAWAWRIWAINAGLAGRSAFAPAAFDARQWRRQVAAARGALAAPGLVPLATAVGTVPVGPVIRTIGRRWTPVLAVPAVWFARHMVIVGSSGSGEDEPDDAAVGWLVCGHAGRRPARETPAAAGRTGLQGRPGRPDQS